jgi:hypothetical protein
MHFEIANNEFVKVFSIIGDVYRDPLLYAVLEGRRPGRIFVDDRENPKAAFVWTNTECAYQVGKAIGEVFYQSIRVMIDEEFIPQMDENGETFLSVITFDQENRQQILSCFDDRCPLSLGLATYGLDPHSHVEKPSESQELAAGFVLSPIDHKVLKHSENQGLAGNITCYWGSVDSFLANSLGTCLLKDGVVVSWCFSEAFGANAHSVNIFTRREYRRRGFAQLVGVAFIDLCVERNTEVAWLCDESNRPARALAKNLGLSYEGCIYPVDIPFYPEEFYTQVADHLINEFENPDQAEELYVLAAKVR